MIGKNNVTVPTVTGGLTEGLRTNEISSTKI